MSYSAEEAGKTKSSGGTHMQTDANPDELVTYVLGAFSRGVPMSLRELYRKKRKYSWAVFVRTVSHLVSEGYLEGRGDGFMVQYLLTRKGRSSLDMTE